MLIAYDAAGEVVGTLDHMVLYDDDPQRSPLGMVNFAAHEEAGGKFRDVWEVASAVGSGMWPEWIGGRAHDFRVELSGGRITALVHKASGYRRERAVVEAAIQGRIDAAAAAAEDGEQPGQPEPADIRDLVGGPSVPLNLDEEGRALPRQSRSIRDALPLVTRKVVVDHPG